MRAWGLCCLGQFELKFKRLTRAGEPRRGAGAPCPARAGPAVPVRGSDSRIRRFFARLGDFLRLITADVHVSMGSRLGERHVEEVALRRGGNRCAT